MCTSVQRHSTTERPPSPCTRNPSLRHFRLCEHITTIHAHQAQAQNRIPNADTARPAHYLFQPRAFPDSPTALLRSALAIPGFPGGIPSRCRIRPSAGIPACSDTVRRDWWTGGNTSRPDVLFCCLLSAVCRLSGRVGLLRPVVLRFFSGRWPRAIEFTPGFLRSGQEDCPPRRLSGVDVVLSACGRSSTYYRNTLRCSGSLVRRNTVRSMPIITELFTLLGILFCIAPFRVNRK